MVKIYECLIYRRFEEEGIKGEKRIIGNRRDIRKHLIEEHHINRRNGRSNHKDRKNGISVVTENTLRREWK